MTALMLVATMNIVLSAHICSSEVYNFYIFEKTTECCHSSSGSQRDPVQTGSLAFSDGDYCCSSMTLETRGVDIVYPSIGIREVDYQAAVLQLEIFDIISLPSSDVPTSVNFNPYLPHLADRDIPVLVQSFLL